MSKFLLLNKDNVIIDIVDSIRYVRKNENGLTILCHQDEAQGYIGSDNEKVWAKRGTQFQPSFSDIAYEGAVESIEDYVVPLQYKFIDGQIVLNEDPYPADIITLTTVTAKNAAVVEYIAMMSNIDI